VDHHATAVTFLTEDGWTIKGTFYKGDPSQPMLILVHGIGEDRRSFDTLVTDLRAKGYNVLAYDSRGMGQSTLQDGRYRDWKTFTEQDFKAMVNDIYSAKYYALSNFMSAPKVGIIGGSIGANEALTFACQTGASDNKALVLLSAGENYRGIQSAPAVTALNLQGAQPRIFFCAAQDDEAGSAAVALSLNASYTGPKQLEMMSGPRHGTQMLTDPAFRTKVVTFLADAFSG
jgi:pimeloyl-ACP methyl ester carboxylesterase